MALWKKILLGVVGFFGIIFLLVTFFTAGAGEAADKVMDQISQGNLKEVYGASSSEFQSAVSFQEFENFVYYNVKNIDLTSTTGHSWNGKGFHNSVKYVYGPVYFANGQTEVMTLTFLEKDGEMQLLEISFGETQF